MKKTIGLFLILCLLVISVSCNSANNSESESQNSKSEITKTEKITDNITEHSSSENDTHILNINKRIHSKEKWAENTGDLLLNIECSTVILEEAEALHYPKLADTLLKNEAEIKKNIINEEFDYLAELAENQISENPDNFVPLISTYDRQVRRADSTVLSILVDTYYFNGVFDSRDFLGENYDTETGKELLFSDVVTDIDGFAKAAEDKLFRYAGTDIFNRDDIIREYFKMYGDDGTHWTLDYNGVTVYFTEGEISSPGFGAMNVTVTFAEHPELFAEKYMDLPEAYTVELPTKLTFYTDLNADGTCEDLTVTDSYDEEYQFYANVNIYTASDYYEEDYYAYSFRPYYIKTADNRHYLYLFAEQDSHMYLYVYDIENTNIKKSGEINVSPYADENMFAVPCDPDNMHFDIYSDEADAFIPQGNDFFSVSTNGMPAQG